MQLHHCPTKRGILPSNSSQRAIYRNAVLHVSGLLFHSCDSSDIQNHANMPHDYLFIDAPWNSTKTFPSTILFANIRQRNLPVLTSFIILIIPYIRPPFALIQTMRCRACALTQLKLTFLCLPPDVAHSLLRHCSVRTTRCSHHRFFTNPAF